MLLIFFFVRTPLLSKRNGCGRVAGSLPYDIYLPYTTVIMRILRVRDGKTTIPCLHLYFNVSFHQDGTVGYDYAFDVAMANDGAVVIASKSNGDFVDVGASASGYSTFASIADGYNFVAVKLDSEGAEVWRWQVSRSHPKYANLAVYERPHVCWLLCVFRLHEVGDTRHINRFIRRTHTQNI